MPMSNMLIRKCCLWLAFVAVVQHAFTTSQTLPKVLSRVVIIGGGPTGLCSAIALQKLGWSNITVLESRPAKFFDHSKSYVYSIDARGQRVFKELNILSELRERSTPFVDVDTKLCILRPDGTETTASMPVKPTDPFERMSLPRYMLLEVFSDIIDDINQAQSALGHLPPIQLHHGYTCNDITVHEQGKVIVRASKDDGQSLVCAADLVLGCDGINSGSHHNTQL